MRIGIDARECRKGKYTGLRTILETFLSSVPREDGLEMVLFCNQHTDIDALPEWMDKKIIRENATFLWDQISLPIALRKEKADVFFSPYIKTPIYRVCPYVSSISDIIPLKISKHKGFMSLCEKIHFALYSFICGIRAAKVVTLSNDAKDKVSKVLGIDTKRIEVVYPAIQSLAKEGKVFEKYKKDHRLDKEFLVYVGNFKIHKNVERLVAAYGLLPGDIKDRYDLLLVGGADHEVPIMDEHIQAAGLSGKVKVVRNVDHNEIGSFLSNASLFVFPSLQEGFGIPPVEAMSMGVPVAASHLTPMTEVLGYAAIYFDPLSPEDMAKKISNVLKDDELKASLVLKGGERAALYNAGDMTDTLLKVIKSAATPKALCVSSEFPPVVGGIATHIYNLWSRLPQDRIMILTADAGRIDDPIENNIIRAKYPTGFNIFSQIARTIAVVCLMWRENSRMKIRKNHAAQVISSGLGALIIRLLKGTPYVTYVYSADILEFEKNVFSGFVLRKVLGNSEEVVANSTFTKGLLTERSLVRDDKILVSTPGVDSQKYSSNFSGDEVRAKYEIDQDTKLLLTVARLAERKGQDNVIRALKRVLTSHPRVRYLLIGDGDTRSYLEQLVAEEGLSGEVIFAGSLPIEELVSSYNACDVFIMVPRMIAQKGDVEGFGIVFLEANACGKPVIGGRTGGVPEAVSDGETGILVDPENVDEIAQAILRLLDDEELSRRLGKNGMARAREFFTWDKRAKELEELI